MKVTGQRSFFGAIVGDIAGSRFEWCNIKSKDFALLVGRGEGADECCFTDDTGKCVDIDPETIFEEGVTVKSPY